MEKDAYHKLQELSLPFPATYQIEELIKEASPEKLYYLRYQPKMNLPKFVNSKYLSEQADFFRQLEAEQKIAQIEDGIVSVIGGCVVTTDSTRYVELVSGHLSGLLLHGWCYVRAYLSGAKWNRKLVPQKLMVEQLIEGNRISLAADIKEELIDTLLTSVKNLLRNIESNYLFEFIVDRNSQVYFVDIKRYEWMIDYAPLLETRPEEHMIYKNDKFPPSVEKKYQGEFSLEKLEKIDASTVICLKDNALLSHFITYSLRRGIAGITT
jgi:hypothetical protein